MIKILEEETRDICLLNYRQRLMNILKRGKPYFENNKNDLETLRDMFYTYLFDTFEEMYRDKELWNKSFQKLVDEVYSPTFVKIDRRVTDVETNNTQRSES